MSEILWVSLVMIAILMLLAVLLIKPFQTIKKLVVKSGIGIALIFFFNYIGGLISLSLPFNPATILIAGFLGIPGIILLTYLQYLSP